MSQKRFYITGSVAGCNQQEAIDLLKPIEDILRLIGITNIFNVSSIDRQLSFQNEMDARIYELSKSDVIVFHWNWNTSVESKIEFTEANRLKKIIRFDRKDDFHDIKLNLIGG